MNRYFVYLLFAFISINRLSAQQATFVTSGKIQYEKRTQLVSILKDLFNASPEMASFKDQMLEQFNKNYKPFQVLNFDLYFSGDKTLYKPGALNAETQELPNYMQFPAQKNEIYSDLSAHSMESLKDIMGQLYIVKDSTRSIHWKITDETREIAGYQCRRANALIMDSIYAVAFYTTQIPVSGGPESISGLPGMILQFAVPHEHSVWTATKVETVLSDASVIKPAVSSKAKVMNGKQFYEALQTSMKSWGPTGKLILRTCLL